jgi:S-adenosylmethionine:tRNA ribosyltransferase-isomerase
VGPYIPVGTTSLRALESLYWAGVWLTEGLDIPQNGFNIPKEFPYIPRSRSIQTKDSLKKVLAFMEEKGIQEWIISTELLIMPGYNLQFCDAIITNFHQPKSTLLVLVSAIIGDQWKLVYQEAILKDYRFLSYGDACLFFK